MRLNAEELKALYERQLAEDLEPPVAEHVDGLGDPPPAHGLVPDAPGRASGAGPPGRLDLV